MAQTQEAPQAKKTRKVDFVGLTASASSIGETGGTSVGRSKLSKFAKMLTDSTPSYGPTKPARNYTIGERILLHSGYVNSALVLGILAVEEDEGRELLLLSTKEYSALKTQYPEILDDATPSSTNTEERQSHEMYTITDSLKVELENEDEDDFRIRIYREGENGSTPNMIIMDKEEFLQLDKALTSFWFVFKLYPRRMDKNEITGQMLEKAALEMIRLIGELYPEARNFGSDAFQDAEYRNAFFSAYATMINLSFINGMLRELEEKFHDTEMDMYTLMHQCLNQIDPLCSTMDILSKK